MQTISFNAEETQAKHGLTLIFDLAGFSQFFNQPDVQDYVPLFFNYVSEALAIVLYGGDAYWYDTPKTLPPLSQKPVHEKFMGDGVMYIWTANRASEFSAEFIGNLCNRLWDLKHEFHAVIRRSRDLVPIYGVPQRIRFGLARGTIYELDRHGENEKEYIGIGINLASRLEGYCQELGFIASARLGLNTARLQANGYLRVAATQIKGFPDEMVIVDEAEFHKLPDDVRDTKFKFLD